jgi:hypothetical protein
MVDLHHPIPQEILQKNYPPDITGVYLKVRSYTSRIVISCPYTMNKLPKAPDSKPAGYRGHTPCHQ